MHDIDAPMLNVNASGACADTKLQKRDSRRHKPPIVNALLPPA